MLCSKLCGLLTVEHSGDVATEKLSVTLAVRAGVATGSFSSDSQQLPSALRKESKLKIQWLELNPGAAAQPALHQSQRSMVGVVTLDVAEAQAALQSSTKDRSRLDAMFRVGGHKVMTTDVQCVFVMAPSSTASQKSTAKFSNQNTLTEVPALDSQSVTVGNSPAATAQNNTTAKISPVSTPPRSAPGVRALSASYESAAAPTTGPAEVEGVRTSTADVTHRSFAGSSKATFWLGFAVGAAFGCTFIVSLVGKPAVDCLRALWNTRSIQALLWAQSTAKQVAAITADAKAHAAKAAEKAAVVASELGDSAKIVAAQTAAGAAKFAAHAKVAGLTKFEELRVQAGKAAEATAACIGGLAAAYANKPQTEIAAEQQVSVEPAAPPASVPTPAVSASTSKSRPSRPTPHTSTKQKDL